MMKLIHHMKAIYLILYLNIMSHQKLHTFCSGFVLPTTTKHQQPLFKSRGVVRRGQKRLKPRFKYWRNAVFSLLLSNEKLNLETPSDLIIP